MAAVLGCIEQENIDGHNRRPFSTIFSMRRRNAGQIAMTRILVGFRIKDVDGSGSNEEILEIQANAIKCSAKQKSLSRNFYQAFIFHFIPGFIK